MKKNILIFLLSAFSLIPDYVFSQFVQQCKLIGIGTTDNAVQGYSVSLSSDGNTALVGSIQDSNAIGSAFVFLRTGGIWSQQGNDLVGIGYVNSVYGVNQGNSVSLSSDGNTAIVGGPEDNSNIGASWVYTRTGGIWTQQGNKLIGTGYIGIPNQGWSVSISADGNTAIFGGPIDGSNGAVWVFTRSGGVWTQQGNKLVGTGAVGNAWQGWSVSLSADGNTAIFGGPYDNSDIGAAWVFTRTGGVWTQQGNKLVGTSAIGGSAQGSSVSISSDGNTALVGGTSDNGGVGAVWVFTRTGGIWTQQGNKLIGSGEIGIGQQGISASISFSGDTAIIGGFRDNNNTGAAWIFIRSAGIWTQQGSKLIGSGAIGFASQGTSVAISSNGTTAIIGGPADNSTTGAAWIYDSNSSGIEEVTKVNNPIVSYPNPASSTITINQSTPSPNQQLVITNILGEEIYHQASRFNRDNSTQTIIDVSQWSNGVYFYEICSDKETLQGKFVVEK